MTPDPLEAASGRINRGLGIGFRTTFFPALGGTTVVLAIAAFIAHKLHWW